MAIAVVALVALAYGMTLRSTFVWDDHELLRLNDFYRDPDLTVLLSPRYFAATRENGYRPLVTLAHLANQALTGLQPWGFRLGNVVLHAVGVGAVFAFVRDRFGGPPAAWAAALYAVHPLHTEAVNVASLRADLLCVPLVLLALTWLRRRDAFRVAGVVAYGLALLAKEEALVLPGLWWLDRRRDARSPWRDPLSLTLVTLSYLWVRFVWLVNPALPRAEPIAHELGEWLGAWTWMLGHYAAVVAAPLELCASYEPPSTWLPWSVAGTAVLVVAGMVALRAAHWRYGLVWFFIALLPVAGVVPLPKPMAERFLTLPVVGLCLAMGVEIARRRSRLWIAGGVIIVVLLFARTLARNDDWRSDERIWAATVRDCPLSARALINYAATLGDRGEEAAAIPLLERALALEPTSATARLNLGLSLLQLGRLGDARIELEAVRDADPRSAVARTYLALALIEQGELVGAEAELARALALDPNELRAHVLLARVYRRTARIPKAQDLLESIVRHPAASAEAHYELAALLAQQGDTLRAIRELERAVGEGLAGATDLASDPELAALRDHPEFQALLRRIAGP